MTLPPNDAKLFFELMWKLQYYVNQKYGFHKNISSMEEYANLPTKQKMKARDELWKTPELIESYTQENPDALPDVVSADRTVERTGSAEEATREALTRASESAAAPGAAEKAAEADFKALAAAQGGLFEAATMDVHVVLPDNVVLRGKNLRPGGPTGAALGRKLDPGKD